MNGKRKTLSLVGTQQADPSAAKISYHSPVGAALSNHLAGETVTVATNGKKIEYKILDVKYKTPSQGRGFIHFFLFFFGFFYVPLLAVVAFGHSSLIYYYCI